MLASDEETADVTTVVETMYRVAADPHGWVQLVDSLSDQPVRDEAPPEAVRGLAHSEEIARIVGAGAAPEVRLSTQSFGWIALTASGRVAAVNARGQAALAGGLGQADPGSPLTFHNPDNAEALTQALAQARATGEQAVLKLERDGDEGPCFGYVAPVRSLADVAYLSGLIFDGTQAGFALLFPAVEESSRLWGSINRNFGLTPAEVRLAERLRDGQSLKEAADALGTSINTVRNQLRAIFDKMGLKRQSDLVRALTELGQVAGVMDGVSSAPPPMPAPPVMFHTLADGRRLAYRDYGARMGRTLLMFHEGLGSSLLPPGVQSLATQLGVRVISAERPGFGRSDPCDDYSFEGVAEDMVALCDGLRVDKVWLAAVLSGAPSAIRTAVRLGDRVQDLLLCAARPPRPTKRSDSIIARFRARMEENPWVSETLYGILQHRLSPSFIERMIAAGAAYAPGDRAYVEANPWVATFVASYFAECVAVSRKGPGAEMRAFRRAGNATAEDLTCPVTVWHGEHDGFAPLSDLMDFLGSRATTVEVFPDTGHLLALRHWDTILHHVAG
jgi:pimeloyl-ACP methyl ester carboxylesterase/DNA-binding CsgD family transcriptional regulator